jgi:hypothetical protein
MFFRAFQAKPPVRSVKPAVRGRRGETTPPSTQSPSRSTHIALGLFLAAVLVLALPVVLAFAVVQVFLPIVLLTIAILLTFAILLAIAILLISVVALANVVRLNDLFEGVTTGLVPEDRDRTGVTVTISGPARPFRL